MPPTPPPTTYTLSLHDALPIFNPLSDRAKRLPEIDHPVELVLVPDLPPPGVVPVLLPTPRVSPGCLKMPPWIGDRKSTRLNSSHRCISYAVFCLKKKK